MSSLIVHLAFFAAILPMQMIVLLVLAISLCPQLENALNVSLQSAIRLVSVQTISFKMELVIFVKKPIRYHFAYPVSITLTIITKVV